MIEKGRSIFQAIGDGAWQFTKDLLDAVEFLGEMTAAIYEAIRHPSRVKWRDTFYYMDICGSDALPIISLLGFLIGVILAFQAVVQLSRFGVDTFVIDLVAVTIVRELGPLMVAIVIAGRSGSAFAAEIGTMKVSEELDAMKTMGFVPSRFVIIPKVLAMFAVMPLLTIFADITGIIGGMTVAYTNIGMSLPESYGRTLSALLPLGFVQGFIKSFAFAFIISIIGCLKGFNAKKDAQGVGRAATSAVVSCIFLIIVADALITILFCLMEK